jgi:membrane-associated phospholipid phosphatase
MANPTTVPVRDASSSVAEPPAPTPTVVRRRAFGTLRLVGGLAYVAWFIHKYNTEGFPFDRERLFLWIAVALLISLIGRPWRRWVQVVIDWLPFAILFLAYDYSRGVADDFGRPVLVDGLVEAERFLFFGNLPAVWVQTDFAKTNASVGWWELGVSVVYASHFVVPFVLAAVLWWRSRAQFQAWVSRLMTMSFIGVLTYIVLPAAPPWYAAQKGLMPVLERPVGRGWSKIQLYAAPQLLERGQAASNEFAALPSLHGGYAFLVSLFLFRRLGRGPWRWLLFLYPLAMAFALVYGGEHYVIDILAGWALGLFADAFIRRRWHRKMVGWLPFAPPHWSAGEDVDAAFDRELGLDRVAAGGIESGERVVATGSPEHEVVSRPVPSVDL